MSNYSTRCSQATSRSTFGRATPQIVMPDTPHLSQVYFKCKKRDCTSEKLEKLASSRFEWNIMADGIQSMAASLSPAGGKAHHEHCDSSAANAHHQYLKLMNLT
jgi:hypothetical protein